MRKFIINVNGNSYEVEVEEVDGVKTEEKPVTKSVESAVKSIPTPKVARGSKTEVKKEVSVSEGQEVIQAPMPGNIWNVLVNEGDTIKAGDVLFILEAMKMQNEIVSPRDGKVASISVKDGQIVSTGEKLIVLD